MKFNEYLKAAKSLQSTDPKKVLSEFKQNFKLVETEEEALELAQLIVQVSGERLGDWLTGIELLRKLKNHANIKEKSTVNIYMGILTLGNNPYSTLEAMNPSETVQVYAGAASALVHLGGVKNAQKFLSLSAQMAAKELAKDDPANQALVNASQSILKVLESKKDKSSVELEVVALAQSLS